MQEIMQLRRSAQHFRSRFIFRPGTILEMAPQKGDNHSRFGARRSKKPWKKHFPNFSRKFPNNGVWFLGDNPNPNPKLLYSGMYASATLVMYIHAYVQYIHAYMYVCMYVRLDFQFVLNEWNHMPLVITIIESRGDRVCGLFEVNLFRA